MGRSPEALARRAERRAAREAQKSAVQNRFLKGLVGQPVIIAFIDGKQLIGELLATDAYTLRVRVTLKNGGGETEMLVYKHSLRYIATAG